MNTATGEITVAPFADAHLEGALRLSREAGWPHRAEDWALTLAFSQGVVALRGGEVVGTALCSRFGAVAMLNMIIVDETLRGRGLARRLMARAMAAAAGCEFRLVATSDGLPFYRKLGFAVAGQVVQHQGVLGAACAPSIDVREGTADDLAEVVRMDGDASGMARAALLARIAATGRLFLTEGGTRPGFAFLRAFGRGHVLGPVVACDAAAAGALITSAAATLPGGFLRIDMAAERAADCGDTLQALGLAPVSGGTAMTRDTTHRPVTPFQTFALVSQGLG